MLQACIHRFLLWLGASPGPTFADFPLELLAS